MKRSYKLLVLILLLTILFLIAAKIFKFFPFNKENAQKCSLLWQDSSSATEWATTNINKKFTLGGKIEYSSWIHNVSEKLYLDATIKNVSNGTLTIKIDPSSEVGGQGLTGPLDTSCKGLSSCDWDKKNDLLTLRYNSSTNNFESNNNGQGFGSVTAGGYTANISSISFTNNGRLSIDVHSIISVTLVSTECFN
tara:strand:- start:87 stop:668 length:582 start_codon:yes stop_codon:yes gene_type:complete